MPGNMYVDTRRSSPWEQFLPQMLSSVITAKIGANMEEQQWEKRQKASEAMKLEEGVRSGEYTTTPPTEGAKPDFSAKGKNYWRTPLDFGMKNIDGHDILTTSRGGRVESGQVVTTKSPKRIKAGNTIYIENAQGQMVPEVTDTSSSNIPTNMKDFELTVYGKETPEKRGTPEYRKKRLSWIRSQKEESPYVDALNRQISVTAKREGTELRKEFNALPEVENYVEIKQKFDVMGEALKESRKTKNFVATDQALITLYNKMTDPQSVVRESEYARTANDLALWNRIKGKMSKVVAGGAGLSQADREALTDMGRKFLHVAEGKYKGRLHEYKGYLTNYGLEPNKYLKPYGADETTENDLSNMSDAKLLELLNAK